MSTTPRYIYTKEENTYTYVIIHIHFSPCSRHVIWVIREEEVEQHNISSMSLDWENNSESVHAVLPW